MMFGCSSATLTGPANTENPKATTEMIFSGESMITWLIILPEIPSP
jgi:hypothetical protein